MAETSESLGSSSATSQRQRSNSDPSTSNNSPEEPIIEEGEIILIFLKWDKVEFFCHRTHV